jgi:MoaA/NifB/PqqE/SkfB family radical SAM enzyme
MAHVSQPAAADASLTIRGPRKAVAVARVALRVIWLALRAYRHPARAARAILRLTTTMRQWTTTKPGRRRVWTSHKCVQASGRYFWDLYAPGFPSAAFDRSIERELDAVDPLGTPTGLQTAIVAITRRCSLACEHCFEGDALNHPDVLSTEDVLEIVRRVKQRGAAQMFFSGGEPLQRFGDLVTFTAAASPGTDVWVLTSGRGLTAGRARRLREAGLTGVAISLDHWDAAAHDRFRGTPGAFDGVRRAAADARAAGLVVALSLCPTRSFVTAANLDRYGDTARAIGAAFIQILEPRSVGRYADRDVALDPAQQRLLEAFCDRLNAGDRTGALPGVRYLDWSRRSFGCGGGDRYVYIDTGGEMHPCPFCRAPGVRALDHDIDTALSRLKAAGCLAGGAHCQPVARTLP